MSEPIAKVKPKLSTVLVLLPSQLLLLVIAPWLPQQSNVIGGVFSPATNSERERTFMQETEMQRSTVEILLEDLSMVEICFLADDLLDNDLWFLMQNGRDDVVEQLADIAIDEWELQGGDEEF